MKTIIVAIDFSDVTEKVINTASELAKTINAQLCIVHAAAPEPTFVGMEVGPQYERDYRAKELVEEHAKLNSIVDDLEKNGVTATCFLKEGMISQVILAETEKQDAGLIIMGSHGHGAVYSLVAGSATLDVLKKTTVPVLVVPARDA